MAWRVGVDSGGTFTDLCLFDDFTGRVEVWKSSNRLAHLSTGRPWPARFRSGPPRRGRGARRRGTPGDLGIGRFGLRTRPANSLVTLGMLMAGL